MNRAKFVVMSTASALLSGVANAAALPRLAIGIEGDGSASETAIERMLTAVTGQLIRSGKYQVVDRNRLAAVIREQGFSNSAYADPKTAAALGKLAGASRILTITLTIEATNSSGPFVASHEVEVSASYSMVGVDSGRILNAGSAQGIGQRQTSAASGSPVSEAQLEREGIDACAEDLSSQIATTP